MVHEVVITQSCPDGAAQAGLAAGHSLLIVRGGGLATGGGDGGGRAVNVSGTQGNFWKFHERNTLYYQL